MKQNSDSTTVFMCNNEKWWCERVSASTWKSRINKSEEKTGWEKRADKKYAKEKKKRRKTKIQLVYAFVDKLVSAMRLKRVYSGKQQQQLIQYSIVHYTCDHFGWVRERVKPKCIRFSVVFVVFFSFVTLSLSVWLMNATHGDKACWWQWMPYVYVC